jgi:general secretion pathway protein D
VVRNPDGTTTTTTGISPDLIEQGAAALAGITGGVAGIGFRAGDALFGAILNAVRSDNTSNLLSIPSTFTLDNQEARFLVGQEIPITTGEALSPNFDNAFRTVQRQNVGITLQVRPQSMRAGRSRWTCGSRSARLRGRPRRVARISSSTSARARTRSWSRMARSP